MTRIPLLVLTIALALICGLPLWAADTGKNGSPFARQQGIAEAPFGNAVSPAVINYSRPAPYVGTAGKLMPGGIDEAKALGFRLIIDLRQPHEDVVTQEIARTKALGLAYINIPLAKDQSALPQIEEIAALLSDASRYPILLHCGSANRAGAAWALYRYQSGVNAETALEEGRAIGMTSKEAMARTLMALPAR